MVTHRLLVDWELHEATGTGTVRDIRRWELLARVDGVYQQQNAYDCGPLSCWFAMAVLCNEVRRSAVVMIPFRCVLMKANRQFPERLCVGVSNRRRRSVMSSHDSLSGRRSSADSSSVGG